MKREQMPPLPAKLQHLYEPKEHADYVSDARDCAKRLKRSLRKNGSDSHLEKSAGAARKPLRRSLIETRKPLFRFPGHDMILILENMARGNDAAHAGGGVHAGVGA